jgi:hypothetical protein
MTRKQARPRKPQIVPTPRSQLIFATLFLTGAVTMMALIIMRWFDVPMGQGFAYRYSKLAELKTATGLWPIIIFALVLAPIAKLITSAKRRALGLSIGVLVMILLVLWTALAIPKPIRQHSVNMVSLSQDGAFVLEAQGIKSLRDYLQHFNERIQRPVSKMGGTRVLANPPGMTILASFERYLFPSGPHWKGWVDRELAREEDVQQPEAVWTFAHGLRFGAMLLLMWALSAPLAYLLGRQFMSPLGSALFALLVTFNPCTVHFSPGKDPAQLLTINAMLLAWFFGVRKDRMWATALAGALLLVGAICGLIHFWIALAALVASLWQAWSERSLGRVLTRYIPSAIIGFFLLALIIYFISGWNCISTLIASGRLYNKIKNTIGINETLWLFLGLPIFLLFVIPGFWTALVLALRHSARDPDAQLGRRLLICTVVSMALSYTLGVSWELPRVWVAYLPLLFLSVMMQAPLVRLANRHALRPIVAIAVVSLIFTGIHWTLLDVRESEYRSIITNRAWF